jgi:hypothetical protein
MGVAHSGGFTHKKNSTLGSSMRGAAKDKQSEAPKTNIEVYGFKKFFHIV